MTELIPRVLVGLLLSSIGIQASAQSRFDNGKVSFEVPQGWEATTNEADGSVRVHINGRSADTILFIFDKHLPSDLKDLEAAIEPRALDAVHTVSKSGVDIRVDKACPGTRRELFSRWQAIDCITLLKDAEGYQAMVAYIGVPLKGITCLVVEFSSNYQGDIDALQKAHDIIEKTVDFPVEKAKVESKPGVQLVAAYPVSQESGWRTYDSADFSFSYPASWTIRASYESSEAWAQDSSNHGFNIRFIPGVPNRANTVNQCASADDALQYIYQTNFEPLDKPANQYPYTKVTHDDFKPGWLGGRSTWVTVTHVEAWQKPVTQEFWINAVPRAGGMYLITYKHPSEPMNVSEPLRRAFIDSIVFKSGPLDKNAYCNFFGQ